MLRIKICGVTAPDDAVAAAAAGADALGINFYPPSPRSVCPQQAADIVAAVHGAADRAGVAAPRLIGVFVNEPVERIAAIQRAVRLTGVQLHGDESPADLAAVAAACEPETWLIRAVRLAPDESLERLARTLAAHAAAGRLPDALLVDAAAGAAYGGTGRTLDWEALGHRDPLAEGVSLLLAGGLHPGNVAAAIAAARPDGVDVASGVESAPGVKDVQRMGQFVAAARAAWGQ